MNIYIMGRGHSGSTILDVLLGGSDAGFSLGEVLSGFFTHEPICSCGKSVEECEFWMAIRHRFNEYNSGDWERIKALSSKYGTIKKLPKILFSKGSRQELEELAHLTYRLTNILSEKTDSKYVVDSSKELTRGYFYCKYVVDSKVIFIVRNGEDILSSYWWRLQQGEEFKFLRKRYRPKKVLSIPLIMVTAGWVIGNVCAEIISRIFSNKVMRIKYEELVDNPVSTLNKIQDFINCDIQDVIAKIENNEEIEIKHMLAGNRIRMKGRVKFNASSEKKYLPRRYKVLFRALAFPLLWLYGYKIFI